MAEEKNNYKTIGIILAIIILIAIFTIIYVNLPKETEEKDKTTNGKTETILSFKFGNEVTNYTLQDIEVLESYTGTGRYIKTKLLPDSVVISDIIEYTGVRITTLLSEIPTLPDKYNVSIISADGWTGLYNMNETLGYVDIYNETGYIISNETAVMILAYKEDGSYYSEIDPDNEIGPLRVAFVGDSVITPSNIWSRMVISIEVIEQS